MQSPRNQARHQADMTSWVLGQWRQCQRLGTWHQHPKRIAVTSIPQCLGSWGNMLRLGASDTAGLFLPGLPLYPRMVQGMGSATLPLFWRLR